MSTFRRLLRFIAPFRWWVLLAVSLGFATIGSSVGLMATSAYIISKAALHPDISVLQVPIVGVRFFGIARGIFRYTERLVSHQVTFRLLAELRAWFFSALEPLAPARLQQFRSGDLLARIVADIESLEHFYVRVIAPPLVAVLVAVLMWVLMAHYALPLAIVTVLFLAAAAIGIPLLTRSLGRGVSRSAVETRAELNVGLVDSVQGVADVLISGQENTRRTTLARLSQKLTALQNRLAVANGLNAALMGLLTNWATLAVLLIAIPLVSRGELDGVFLAVIALAVIAAFEAVTPLPETFTNLEGSLAAADRLFQVVDTEPQVVDPPAPSPQPESFGLEVRDLRFSYRPDDPPALDGIDFSLPEGGRLAIVGSSGAGKSTLVNLLLRFWAYRHGEILLGGHDLRRYRADDVRRMVSVVSQHTHLFNATIAENLRLSRPDATDADLIAAAEQAQIHTFIQSLPQGYSTFIGEQGLRLSGGERQRLAIARALLKNAPILILDEATSNLDPLVEREIMATIHRLMRGRTTLMITHRLVGLDAMDEILVLSRGKIAERGTHASLMAENGIYRNLWDLQHQVDLLDAGALPIALTDGI